MAYSSNACATGQVSSGDFLSGLLIFVEIDEVRQTAELARITIDGDGIHAMRESLSAVLALIDTLSDEGLEEIEPLGHSLDISQHLRADEVSEKDRREAIQAVAPRVTEGLYLVPKVIE